MRNSKPDNPPVFQLAIQGGGAKICNLLAALEGIQDLETQDRIRISRVAGTSAGALAGAVFAAGIPLRELRDQLRLAGPGLTKQLFPKTSILTRWRRLLFGRALWDERQFRELLNNYFARLELNTLEHVQNRKGISLLIVSSDIVNLRAKVYDSSQGQDLDLVSAILDSCAIPFIFRSWKNAGSNAVLDGALCRNLPAQTLTRGNYGKILAVAFPPPTAVIPDSPLLFLRALLETAMSDSTRYALSVADYPIEIRTEIGTLDFEKAATEGLDDMYDRIKADTIRQIEETALLKSTTTALEITRACNPREFWDYLRSKVESNTPFSIQLANDICRFIESQSSNQAGLDEDFAGRMGAELKSKKWTSLYFVDILGSSPWLSPTFLRHMAYQIRWYIRRNYRTGLLLKEDGTHAEPNNGRIWHLHFQEPLLSALRKAADHGRDFYPATQSDAPQFSWILRDSFTPTPEDTRLLAPRFEIARILIWSKDDLLSVPGEVLVQLHKVMKIPLFFIDREELSLQDLRVLSRYEYHVFWDRNDRWLGEYYDSEAKGSRRPLQRNALDPPIGLENLPNHFFELLRHQRLYFAFDMLRFLKREAGT